MKGASLEVLDLAIFELEVAQVAVEMRRPGAVVRFRYCATTKTGEGGWSAPIAVLVPSPSSKFRRFAR